MKLKQLKQWLEEAEKKFGENTEIYVLQSSDGIYLDVEKMVYDFSEKLLKLIVED